MSTTCTETQIWFGPVELALFDAVDRVLWPLGSAVSGPCGGHWLPPILLPIRPV